MTMGHRSTLRLVEQLDRADVGGQSVVLTGNTSDYVVAADGSPRRLQHQLAAWAAEHGRATIIYSTAEGARQLPLPGGSPISFHLPNAGSSTADAIDELFAQIRSSAVPVQLIVDYGGHALQPVRAAIVPEHNRVIELVAEFVIDPEVRATGHRMTVITRTGSVDDQLFRLPGVAVINVELPDFEERLIFITRLLQPQTGQPLRLVPDMTPERLAALTGGLSLFDLLRARDESAGGIPIGHEWVQAQKAESLRRIAADNLIVHPPGKGIAEVAGLPQIRLLLREALDSGRFPRRLLLAGPPGVGKTVCVTAIADELGVPAIALGNVRSMWVGESERNFRAVLDVVDALAPLVLHIDEIDQAVGQRQTGQSSDGGTSERLLADLMTFLGSNGRKRVTVIATTNRPDLLDSAMFDRFTVIPILHPTSVEAAQILIIAATREDRVLMEDVARRCVERTDQLLTGRVLVDVLDRAMTFADADGCRVTIEETHLDAAFEDLLMALDPDEHEYLALQAIQLTTFQSYLPWKAAEALGEPIQLPQYLPALLDGAGLVSAEKLRARIDELRGGHGAR